ncbi:uncharacterized protein LOC116344075 isoform X2 [Contarinia nasturtii]|uniref:uncharacterized protein LOC116344075 isoform X2 n=1 Tax=Contarinia nasturtii TaxID=265458 RepID=UPI0012D39931|nr:uncharacterized protein LOC116344075 isoform X2 [Contarinia nasturtii]
METTTEDIQEKTAETNQTTSIVENNEDDLITLNGCGIQTKWRYPKNIKHCIVLRCDSKFGTHKKAIDHYKEQHAEKSILCPICIKPIVSKDQKPFIRHYERVHPTEQIPYFHNKAKQSVENNEDDLISLNGCGNKTKWHYPENITHCVVSGCKLTFKSRAQAIAHYKEQHAYKSILCPICIKPIVSRNQKFFIRHYERVHPTEKIPYFHDKAKQSTSMVKNNENDLITLNGCGIETTWHYPGNIMHCIVLSCKLEFKTRAQAIAHYKKQHADKSILCRICMKPIVSKNKKDFIRHYERVHFTEKIPYFQNYKKAKQSADDDDIGTPDKYSVYCDICNKPFFSIFNKRHLHAHFKRYHPNQNVSYRLGMNMIEKAKTQQIALKSANTPYKFCPWKKCSFKFKSNAVGKLRDHCKVMHSKLRFPELRKGQEYPSKASIIGDKTPETCVEQDADGLLTPMPTMQRHPYEDSDNEYHHCKLCSRSFRSMDALHEHTNEEHYTYPTGIKQRQSTNNHFINITNNVSKRRRLVSNSPNEAIEISQVANDNPNNNVEGSINEIDAQQTTPMLENVQTTENSQNESRNDESFETISLSDDDNEDDVISLSDDSESENEIELLDTIVDDVNNCQAGAHIKTHQVLMMFQPELVTVEIPSDTEQEEPENPTTAKQVSQGENSEVFEEKSEENIMPGAIWPPEVRHTLLECSHDYFVDEITFEKPKVQDVSMELS